MATLPAQTRPVPADFPRARPQAALAGAQPKVAVRLVDGEYVTTLSDDEATARFEMCDDLLVQLLPYCIRKQAERPEWSVDVLMVKVASSLRVKGWDLTESEIAWLVKQLGQLLDTRGERA